MKHSIELSGPLFNPATGQPPESLVILIHGLGADGHDLISLAPHLAPSLPDTVFVSPNAPFPCDMAPYGFQWFSLLDRTPEKILQGVYHAHPILDDYIDQQLAHYSLDESKLALIGFSQGTMMALHTGLRRGKSIAGIVGFSGAMIQPPPSPVEIHSPTSICLIHGKEDEVVPFESMLAIQKELNNSGYPIAVHPQKDLGHSINEEGLKIALSFLRETLY